MVGLQSAGGDPAGPRPGAGRRPRAPERQRGSVPRPGPGHPRDRGPVSGRLRRGGGAADRHPAGGDLRRHARPARDAHQVAFWPGPPAQPVRVRLPVQGSPPGSDQPDAIPAAAAGRHHAADFPAIADRRDLPLHAQVPQGPLRQRRLHAQRPQGTAGLGAGPRLPADPAHRRRQQHRRHHQALRDPSRPGPPAPLRHHADATPGGADEQQPEHRGRSADPGAHHSECSQRRSARRRPGPGAAGAGLARSVTGRPHPSRRGEPPHPRNPPDRHRVQQQRTHQDRRRCRGRSGPARRRSGSARRRGRPPDAPRPGQPEQTGGTRLGPVAAPPRRPGRASHGGLARRGRQGPVHRHAPQGRGLAAGPQGGRGQVQGAERSRNGPNAAGRQDRDVLRSRRPDPRHHRDGPGEPAAGHRPGDHDPVHVPEQRADRPDRGPQHPAGLAVRLLGAVPARQVGQPALHRRRRFRHHRR